MVSDEVLRMNCCTFSKGQYLGLKELLESDAKIIVDVNDDKGWSK